MPTAKTAPALTELFDEVKALLIKHSKGLDVATRLENSTAKEKKPMIGLIGKKDVAIGNRKPQKTYVAGIILQKNFLGFYSMPIYSHPKQLTVTDPDLKKARKGKSCINLTKLTPSMKNDLERIIKEGIALYKKEGWI